MFEFHGFKFTRYLLVGHEHSGINPFFLKDTNDELSRLQNFIMLGKGKYVLKNNLEYNYGYHFI